MEDSTAIFKVEDTQFFAGTHTVDEVKAPVPIVIVVNAKVLKAKKNCAFTTKSDFECRI